MTTCDAIAALLLHDVSLAVEGDQLLIDGPEGGIMDDAEILKALSQHKREILAILRRNWPDAVRALVERDAPDHAGDLIEAYEERAAWLEYCGDLPRIVAEELAYHEIAIKLAEAETDACFVGHPTRVRMEIPYACTSTSIT